MSKTFSLEDASAASIQVVTEDKGGQAIHDLITAYRANRRSGTANTKTRGEVRGSNKKLWRQKGTGRARAGSVKNPVWRGGGVVFGPRPRSYAKTVNKATRKLALRKVLGDLITQGNILTVPSFSIEDGKTKTFVQATSSLSQARRILIVSENFDTLTKRAARNVAHIHLMSASELNIEHLLLADTVILVEDSFEVLARRTA